jgi:uncharacterized repeat protein (TIGR01451 family)
MSTKISESLVLVSRQNGVVVIPAATPLTRLNYFDGKFLRASDLKAEQDYLRQLVFQSNQAGGAGVAYGFDLTLGSGDLLDIGQGLAIDPNGRVLLLPQGTSVSMQELISKSRDLQQRYGSANVVRAGGFETCEVTSATPPVSTTPDSDLYLIVVSPADALCGEEDVYGKLCEEACATSTDRPFAVEGLILRAVPLVLQTPLPRPKVVALSQTHLRSRVASAYFEDERRRVASLISKFGLEQETWCLGADAAGGNGVPIGVIARAGSTTVFLDPWIARRERIDTPARRYWQWRMMMRPWDVFLAQILQFQCQLRDLFRRIPTPGGEGDPCGGAHGAISDAANTITELQQFYVSTAQRFTELNVNLDEAITFKGGLSRLTALNDRLVSVRQGLSTLPRDRFLIYGGIVELPSAGYLPVVPGAAATINQQVRRLMGEGVDLRFCVVRPDYVAHALEEAQHMERISLLQGLDDPKNKPEVDILVPNGEVLEQKLLSPGTGFEASVDLNQTLISPRPTAFNEGIPAAVQTMNFRGAARTETLPTGGGAFYLSCDHTVNLYTQFIAADTQISATQPVETNIANAVARPAATVAANEVNAIANPSLLANNVNLGPIEYQLYQPPRLGLWTSLRCDSNIFKLGRGDTANFNASAIVANANVKTPLLDIQLNGVFQIIQEARTTGTSQRVIGHIENAQLSYAGAPFGNAGARTPIFVDLDVSATLTAGSAIEIVLNYKTDSIVLSANWGNEPLAVSAAIIQEFSGNNIKTPQSVSLAHANLKENSDVLSAKNGSHIQALAALEIIAKILNDANFADAKARLLFPPPPKPTDELIVRGTMDWVLFHRRRTRRCSQEVCVTPVAPPRHYQVYHFPIESLQELEPVHKRLLEGKIPESAFNSLPFVDFAGGGATMLTNPQAWRADWANIQPGNSIVYAGIANRDSAAADGDVLALSRLGRLVDAVAPVSTPNAQMQTELLSQVPSSIPAVNVDGVIFLFTIKAADLKINKTASPGEIVVGNDITYTITITNTGPATAQNVTVSDPLPPNATFVSARGLGAAATEWRVNNLTVGQTGTVLFSKASVASGETASFEIVVKAHASATGAVAPIVNTATVASVTGDPNAANNSASTTTPVLQPPSADLRITKSATPSQVTAGGNITYTLILLNSGPGPAQGVTVTDVVPPNTTFVSAQATAGSGWTQTAPAAGATGNVVFAKPLVAAGETATFQIVVRTSSATPTTGTTAIVNTARVTSTTTDPNLPDNTSTTTTPIAQPQSADLRITKTVTPLQFTAGGSLTYTLTLTNTGPTAAQGVILRDPLPAGTSFVSVSVLAGWTSSAPAVGGTGTVSFTKSSSMAPGETATFQIVVKVTGIIGAAVVIPSVVTNTAAVESSTTDPLLTNNSASATSTLSQPPPSADLRISKSATPNPVTAGGDVTYTIELKNLGPSIAQNVIITDALPPSTTFVSAVTPTGWNPSLPPVGSTTNHSVAFTKASVAVNETAVFRIVVRTNQSSTAALTNSVAATSSTSDPTQPNNATAIVNVALPALRTTRLMVQIDSDQSGQRFFATTQPPVLTVQFKADGSLNAPLSPGLINAIRAVAASGLRGTDLAASGAAAATRLSALVSALRSANLLQAISSQQVVPLKPSEQIHLDLGGGVHADDVAFLIRGNPTPV